MTREDWDRRQAQWKQFQAWEATQHVVTFSPAERLAEVGALVDLAHRHRRGDPVEADVDALIAGIRVMHARLAVLSHAA